MSELKLFFLGPPRVELDGAPIEFQRRKALALLIYLAVSGQAHARDALATLFWPDQSQSRARAYLRRDLAVLNTSLNGEWLEADRETIELKSGAESDVAHFRRLLAECQTHGHAPEAVCAVCLPLLTEAVSLYTDDFLAGFTLRDSAEFDDWQFFQAESLRQELAQVLERLVRGHSAQGEYGAAIPYARRWVALDTLHEPAQQHLMQLYDQSGQPAAALRQYEEYANLLETEFGLPPEEEITTLYEVIKAKRILGSFIKAEERAGRIRPQSAPEATDEAGTQENLSGAAPEPDSSTLAVPAPSSPVGSTLQAPGSAGQKVEQQIHFCTAADGVRIAYAVAGEGPVLVKAANWLSHLEFDWDSPVWRHWLAGLTRHHTLVRYDERGCGLSDWDVEDFSVDAMVGDLESVIDDLGLERFPLLGVSQGGPVAIAYAVRHPEKVSHLILYGTYARGRFNRDYSPEEAKTGQTLLSLIELGWGQDNPAFRQFFTTLFMPEAKAEQMNWFNDLQRVSTSPEVAVRLERAFFGIDVSQLVPKVSVPTLVLHGRDDGIVAFEEGRQLAARIPGARFVALDSKNHILLESEPAWQRFLSEVHSFVGAEVTERSQPQLTPVHTGFSMDPETELAEVRQPVQIYLLGRFEARRGERVLRTADWSHSKAAALLQRLALERRLSQDEAIDFLQPEAEPAAGANDLDDTLDALRQTLDAALGAGVAEAVFSFEEGVLSLNESVWVDIHEFERLSSHLTSPASNGQFPASELQQALALYRGDLLPEAGDADWTLTPREDLRLMQRQAVLTLAAYQREAGEYAAAISLLTQMLTHAPTDEAAHRELMRLYSLDGRHHEALRQYQACAEVLAAEFDAAPDAETDTLYKQILNGDVVPPSALTPRPAWLPPAPIAVEVERSVPLAGREGELETLLAKIRTGWEGGGGTILLAGDSGVGKTRLAYEALRAAALSRMTTLVGAAYEQEGCLPYQPFIEAFDRYLAEQGRPPEQHPITHYQPLGATDLQQEHSALFKATASFLTGLATRTPVVLLLDDLHAADEASLSLFHYLVRQTRSAPVILLATYRTDTAVNATSPFGSLLNALYREHLSQVLHLTPLPEQAGAKIISHILGGEADAALVKAIFDSAEGNPFFVQEITRAVLKADRLEQEQGQWRLRPGATLRIPSGLRELLRERVQRLGPTVESVLTDAAVIGREFRFAVLREVTGLPDGELLDALDVAIAAHLLEETEEGYRFRHSLIRDTLYDALSRRRRAWRHARAAEAIETAYATRAESFKLYVEALAFHYDLSDQRDRALPYLLQAGQKAANMYALEVANDYFERALALMNELGINDPAQRWPILEQLGWWALVLADTPRAVARFEEALALPATETWQPDPIDQARVHRLAARTLISAGDAAAAEQHLQEALAKVGEAGNDSVDYAYVLYDVALWHWHRNEYQEASEVARRSLDIAERVNDQAAIARAYEVLALTSHSLGEWQQGLSFEDQRAALVGPDLDVTEAFDVHL
jgi:DNA-binding SARP family transcriptional activator/pimeloyl-ACP methyl ester carboxylesterase